MATPPRRGSAPADRTVASSQDRPDDAPLDWAPEDPSEPTRGANGRFRPGHCPNPAGRGAGRPKVSRSQARLLLDVFADEVEVGAGAKKRRISVAEALLRSACQEGLRDPQIALKLLSFANALSRTEPAENPETTEDDAAAAFLAQIIAQKQRPRPMSQPAPAEAADDEAADDEEGAP